MKSLKSFMLLSIASLTFIACETNNNKIKLSTLKYWPNNPGDTIIYVNEQNDSLVAVVSCIIKGFDPEDPEVVELAGDDLFEGLKYDEILIYATTIDTNNFYHKKLDIVQSCIYYDEGWGQTAFAALAYKEGKTEPTIQLTYDSSETLTNTDNLFPDTIHYMGYDVESKFGAVIAEAVRNKGITWWSDMDGIRWELVK
ncbi:MAG: hypothetical protein Q4D14_03800 [Bacteroidales bacterium]|nr:hypothetical protein [Bacteroidales bacterium]